MDEDKDSTTKKRPGYPLPVSFHFCPGGVRTTTVTPAATEISLYDQVQKALLEQAAAADSVLNESVTPGTSRSYFVPSLSVLAEGVFGRLTGCSATTAKEWADAMILSYYNPSSSLTNNGNGDDKEEDAPTTAAALLKQLRQKHEAASDESNASRRRLPRPCGYVFQRGDIAWNCRTCQFDPTCVICDVCFRNSNHDGHEVYFHRTTPGGCCDCGDAEAWKSEGCCEEHRPALSESTQENMQKDDPMEAVGMGNKGLEDQTEVIRESGLSKRLLAVLGAVIGAAVHAIVDAVDGAGVGADPTQWRMRWADEAAQILNSVASHDDYCNSDDTEGKATPATFLMTDAIALPDGYSLQLRLHNDDVHTFDEVIDALHQPLQLRRNSSDSSSEPASQSLVPLRARATEMTHHVDADGQVTVKSYSSFSGAMQGYRRLKSHGLHCAVVSTAQVQLELRARALVAWLADVSAAHPAAAALVVHALVQVSPDHDLAGVQVWPEARMIPSWAGMDQTDENEACRKRFQAFPPHLASSYVTREEAELLHGIAVSINPSGFVELTGATSGFYSKVPYRLPSERYRKSPHALWGTLPALYSDPVPPASKHPLLQRLVSGNFDESMKNNLTESVFVVDTDLRKQQEADRITTSVFPHKLPGLSIISGMGTVHLQELSAVRPPLPSPMDLRHLLATSSFRAPVSSILILLLLDPYPTKQLRAAIHALFLSLLTDSRFRCRFAGAIGISYRPLSTLFCAGVGTEADTPLHFTVQIFTAGSLVRALGNAPATEKLLLTDQPGQAEQNGASIGVFASPIAHTIVRCIHTNLLGATKEVNMILNNTSSGDDDNSQDESHLHRNDSLLPALTYVAGEHPLLTPLPAAPDDGFLDSRSTRHKRLPHLLRDLEYVIETPGTASRLLLPETFPVFQGRSLSLREDILSFPAVYSRMLRLAQGMDPQKRKISGGHVEYEQNRWLEAFGLSLNSAGTRDALTESPVSYGGSIESEDGAHLAGIREAIGNLVASLLREMKLWLYREGMLETGLLVSPAHGTMELAQAEALQRSTLHVSSSHFGADSEPETTAPGIGSVNAVALACATGIKMTESQLSLIENALMLDAAEKQPPSASLSAGHSRNSCTGAVMGDWLRVPHSPLAGDSLSFHLPLHRALAKSIKSICTLAVPESIRDSHPRTWWKIPVLDCDSPADSSSLRHQHPLVNLIRSTLRSSNCRVVWTAGPECSSQEAQRRRSRSRTVSANIAVAKILHSIADHPIRCIAAAQQIERHLWARNGTSVAGMAMNYSSTPLCRSFRDLDILLVQFSASGMSCGLGARRVFALLLSRFSMDGYLCDPERRSQGVSSSGSSYGPGTSIWVNPPRLQDPDHAVVLCESFFLTLCVIVSELPPPPPTSWDDKSSQRQTVRRELLHALAAEPRSHSEAMAAASTGMSRREETEGTSGGGGGAGTFREVFTQVLNEVARRKSPGASRASSGPPTYELRAECCDEYDPTFFHLRRQEHQHAMDVVARLRKQKGGDDKEMADSRCLPLVCPPPKAHPRFVPCRLLLHLQSMDAAIRRSLLFALTGGSWLPPPEPTPSDESVEDNLFTDGNEMAGALLSDARVTTRSSSSSGDVPVTTIARRLLQSQSAMSSSFPPTRRSTSGNVPAPFSREVVAASSVSFLEVLQLLTLQVHTLEECASLHWTLPDLDDESRALSAGLSINSYLGRLVRVPDSLVGIWALKPYPEGPLQSTGSGEKRGSILGLLIALYEHRADHAAILDSDSGDFGKADDGHGGARSLATSGLKWLLRFVSALVDGAPSVGAATKSATTGVPVRPPPGSPPSGAGLGCSSWTIDDDIRSTIRGMLANLPDLWPKERVEKPSPGDKPTRKSKEARKAAQMRVMEMMKRKQEAFAKTIAPSDEPSGDPDAGDSVNDLCIICRCDDVDGDNNGPLGYLGHVQRSRVAQIRATTEAFRSEGSMQELFRSYRVVGHMGCQLRENEAMDSKPLTCLPKGSVVTVLKSTMSMEYDVLSRRVLVRHVKKDPHTAADVVTEGWASVQSSQGYVILSPLASLCYTNTAWGGTRPIIKQCGHAAHLKCVETHTLSLHQRAAGEQPYDGRFAANIADGEFLCPLCKQLSNILIPRDNFSGTKDSALMDVDSDIIVGTRRSVRCLLNGAVSARLAAGHLREMDRRALSDFGSQLYNAMSVAWDRPTGWRKKQQLQWHPAIQKWDFEDNGGNYDDDDDASATESIRIKSVLRLLRQQVIAWAAVGHSASASEAGSRGVEEVLPFGVISQTSDPWQEFDEQSRDSHAMVLDLKRTLTAASGLLVILCHEMKDTLARREPDPGEAFVVGSCLADILDGRSWMLRLYYASESRKAESDLSLWSELTAFMSSMPCHVARDGVLPQRCEARATAAAMWATKGIGSAEHSEDDPPAPLAVNQLVECGLPPVPRDWGTMEPFFDHGSSCSADDDDGTTQVAFRPAVASSYLYKPLLAWDLYTLSGAVLSCAISTDTNNLPTSEELLHFARVLVIGRMIQAIATPGGIEMPDESESEDFWSESELQTEESALAKLVIHCKTTIKNKFPDASSRLKGESAPAPSALLAGVGQAILPFSRALVLMLRACSAAIRERQTNAKSTKPTAFDKILDSVLFRPDLMTCEDGFLILKELQGPLPSALIDPCGEWKELIDRWIISAIGFELHHGSMGQTILPKVEPAKSAAYFAAVERNSHPVQAISSIGESASQETGNNGVSVEEDAMDIDEADEAYQNGLLIGNNNVLMDEDLEESDEEILEAEDVDEAEEIVDFAAQIMGVAFGASLNAAGTGDGPESEDNSSSGTEDDGDTDREFAHVSRSPILPYQPSLLGLEDIGPGRQGAMFEFAAASAVMADLSHLGSIHRKEIPTFSLIRLPKSFVELYNVVSKVKGRDDTSALDESDDASSSETAICLLTGTVMRSGSSRRGFSRSSRPPGACTIHARKHGSGIGIFFLVQKCTVLLMHNNKSAYSPSLYVDDHGEEDPGLRRGRPLYLNEARYRALEKLWRQQGIPREVAQIRSTSDRVIRDNWY